MQEKNEEAWKKGGLNHQVSGGHRSSRHGCAERSPADTRNIWRNPTGGNGRSHPEGGTQAREEELPSLIWDMLSLDLGHNEVKALIIKRGGGEGRARRMCMPLC